MVSWTSQPQMELHFCGNRLYMNIWEGSSREKRTHLGCLGLETDRTIGLKSKFVICLDSARSELVGLFGSIVDRGDCGIAL